MEQQTHLHTFASNSHAQQWKQIKFSKQLSVSMPCGEHRLLSGFFKSNKQTVKKILNIQAGPTGHRDENIEKVCKTITEHWWKGLPLWTSLKG
jgi:hypothetical protein